MRTARPGGRPDSGLAGWIWSIQQPLDFPGTVYGVPRGTPARELMTRQSEWFGAHRHDRVIDPPAAR